MRMSNFILNNSNSAWRQKVSFAHKAAYFESHSDPANEKLWVLNIELNRHFTSVSPFGSLGWQVNSFFLDNIKNMV